MQQTHPLLATPTLVSVDVAYTPRHAGSVSVDYRFPSFGFATLTAHFDGNFTGRQHGRSSSDLVRQTAIEGDHQQLTSSITHLNEAFGLGSRYNHRFFQQHIKASFETRFSLFIMIRMRCHDESHINAVLVLA